MIKLYLIVYLFSLPSHSVHLLSVFYIPTTGILLVIGDPSCSGLRWYMPPWPSIWHRFECSPVTGSRVITSGVARSVVVKATLTPVKATVLRL